MSTVPASLAIPSRDLAPYRLLAVLGVGTLAFSLALDSAALWPALLFAGVLLFGVGLGCMYFLAISALSGAGWLTAIRRAPEALTALVPVGGAITLLAIAGGARRLYPWYSGDGHGYGPFKSWWLAPDFFFARAVGYVVVLSFFWWRMRRTSNAQDADGDVAHTHRYRRLSAGFLVFGSVLLMALSTDWLMSLEPSWYSTMFGVYHFAGLFQGGLAVVILLVVWLSRRGLLGGVARPDHVHDVAKFLFGMSTFWMYIWYSQYILIWYTNIPEETVYYTSRLAGGWWPLFWVCPILNWVIPFHALLPWKAKQSFTIASRIAVLVVVGRLLDLYLMIYPAVAREPFFGVAELGALLVVVGLPLLVVERALRRVSPVPVGDPFLAESLHHHQ